MSILIFTTGAIAIIGAVIYLLSDMDENGEPQERIL